MKAAAAAETGADRTATLTARAGRASYVARDKVKNVLCSPRQLLKAYLTPNSLFIS